MGSLTLTIQYQKNNGLVFNSSELKNLYFTGIELKDQYGNPIPEETISFYIEAAQKELSDLLSIKLTRLCYTEKRNYVNDDYLSWGYVPTTYPVVAPVSLKGFLNTSLQINYPVEWLSAKSQSPDQDLYHRSMSLVPIAGGVSQFASGTALYIAPFVNSYFGSKSIPNYWEVMYITGFNRIPADILNAIGKFAAINLLLNLGDIITGIPGVSGKSIGIDGLSQSVTSTANAQTTGFGARIKAYYTELNRQIPLLKARYTGIIFGVLG